MIDPGTDSKGEDMEEYCIRRWGGSGWTRHLKTEGRKDGAKFENWKWWPNTLKAHQLVEYCTSRNVCSSDKINELLFEAEYEKGRNLSLVDDLCIVAQTAGVTSIGEVRQYLTNNEGVDVVKQQIDEGRRNYKISGVPLFIVSSPEKQRKPYGLSGAQASETLLELFEELSEKN
jgi:predicted DsbA family dithiol-disulfide isomerase